MVKMFCDRCGKEISEDYEYYKDRKYDIVLINHENEPVDECCGYVRKPVHLCPDCEKWFDEFLNGGKIK